MILIQGLLSIMLRFYNVQSEKGRKPKKKKNRARIAVVANVHKPTTPTGKCLVP